MKIIPMQQITQTKYVTVSSNRHQNFQTTSYWQKVEEVRKFAVTKYSQDFILSSTA